MSGEINWVETHRGVVHPWHCDQYGHMNVRWYAHIFDDAAFHIWNRNGINLSQMQANGYHTVIARTETDYVEEALAGDMFYVRSALVKLGTKSCTFQQEMFNADSGTLHARQSGVEVFFNPKTRKAIPIPDEIRSILEAN